MSSFYSKVNQKPLRRMGLLIRWSGCDVCFVDLYWFVVVVQSLSCDRLFATPWTVICQAHPSSTVSWSLLKFMSIESVMLSNHLILCHPLLCVCMCVCVCVCVCVPVTWKINSLGTANPAYVVGRSANAQHPWGWLHCPVTITMALAPLSSQ